MRFFIFISIIFTCSITQAQRLNVFGAELGKQERNGKELRMPYNGTKCYFGFIDSTWKVADTAAGKSFYYLYFNLPDTAEEIGVRLMSPVSTVIFPDKGDVVEKGYYDYRKNNNDWFDPWIALERQIFYKDSANSDSIKSEWIMLAGNDDNDELFEQPSWKKTNALFRVISDSLKVTLILEPALYRIVISSTKAKELSGSFILQIGTSCKLYGVKISRKEFVLPIE
jgi:hypothetical protein